MVLPIHLFKLNSEDKWVHLMRITNKMNKEKRDHLSNIINIHFNEEIPERLIWGVWAREYLTNEIIINNIYRNNLYPYNGPPTKLPFRVLKNAWYKAFGQTLNTNINDDTIVCLVC